MPRINQLYAYVTVDSGPDDEGIASFWAPGLKVYMPMVGADIERLESLRSRAIDISHATGKTIRVVRFSHREEIEVIEP